MVTLSQKRRMLQYISNQTACGISKILFSWVCKFYIYLSPAWIRTPPFAWAVFSAIFLKLCFLQLQKFIDYEIGGKYFIISLYTFKVRFLYFFVLVKLSWQCILIALTKCVKSCSLKLFLECLCLLPCHWLFNSSLDTVRLCLLITLIKCLTVSNCLMSLWDCSLTVYFWCIYKEWCFSTMAAVSSGLVTRSPIELPLLGNPNS